jgi:hypothetical protein
MAPPDIKPLLPRLPRTFGPALSEQIRRWDLLFPAEQRRLQAQLDHIAGLDPGAAQRLLSPISHLESKMNLPGFDSSSVQQVGVLARSPLYPQWRGEVERVFGQIDDAIEAAGTLRRFKRLLICELPAGLPYNGAALWTNIAAKGRWTRLGKPFADLRAPLLSSLNMRPLPAGLESVESSWVVNASPTPPPASEVFLDWEQLAPLRREFLTRLNTIRRDLKDVDQTNEELRRSNIDRFVPQSIAAAPRVREFIRNVLLTGNGALVFPSSFVQWTASEAIRRAQPQVLYASFGLRARLKPFSSLVLFEDQARANPTPEENDPAGSLIDAQLLAEYVYLSAARLLPHADTDILALFTAAPLDRALVLGPNVALTTAALAEWLA